MSVETFSAQSFRRSVSRARSRATACRDRRGDHGERDMPPAGPVLGHPVGLRAFGHGAGPAEPYPSGFGHPDLADVAGDAADIPLPAAPPGDAESLVPPGLAPRRPPGRVARVEERGHRLSEVAQGLLLDGLGAGGQPRVLRAGGGELPALLQVAGSALPAGVTVGVLLDGQVPHVPGVAAVVPQHRFLGGGGEQAVPGHANTLASTTDISGKVTRRFLPGLKAGVTHAAILMSAGAACLPGRRQSGHWLWPAPAQPPRRAPHALRPGRIRVPEPAQANRGIQGKSKSFTRTAVVRAPSTGLGRRVSERSGGALRR
jgi:hypothetical protein